MDREFEPFTGFALSPRSNQIYFGGNRYRFWNFLKPYSFFFSWFSKIVRCHTAPLKKGYHVSQLINSPNGSMTVSAKHWSVLVALHRQWWHLSEWKILQRVYRTKLYTLFTLNVSLIVLILNVISCMPFISFIRILYPNTNLSNYKARQRIKNKSQVCWQSWYLQHYGIVFQIIRSPQCRCLLL